MLKLDAQLQQKRERAIRLRTMGATYDQIAKELGYANKGGAYKAVKAGLHEAIVESAMEMRVVQNDKLDLLLSRCLTAFMSGDLDQVKNILAIEKRRADLWGLDASKQVAVTGADGGPVQTDVGQVLLERLRQLGEVVSDAIDVSSDEVLPNEADDSVGG
jgi:hypothetical protein